MMGLQSIKRRKLHLLVSGFFILILCLMTRDLCSKNTGISIAISGPLVILNLWVVTTCIRIVIEPARVLVRRSLISLFAGTIWALVSLEMTILEWSEIGDLSNVFWYLITGPIVGTAFYASFLCHKTRSHLFSNVRGIIDSKLWISSGMIFYSSVRNPHRNGMQFRREISPYFSLAPNIFLLLVTLAIGFVVYAMTDGFHRIKGDVPDHLSALAFYYASMGMLNSFAPWAIFEWVVFKNVERKIGKPIYEYNTKFETDANPEMIPYQSHEALR